MGLFGKFFTFSDSPIAKNGKVKREEINNGEAFFVRKSYDMHTKDNYKEGVVMYTDHNPLDERHHKNLVKGRILTNRSNVDRPNDEKILDNVKASEYFTRHDAIKNARFGNEVLFDPLDITSANPIATLNQDKAEARGLLSILFGKKPKK